MFHPKFSITNPILKHIGQIEGAKEVVDYAVMVPAWEAKFKEEAKVRTVHFGTKIEGNELNYSQAQRVMEGEEVIARERDIQEVINYRNVLEYIDRLGERYNIEGPGRATAYSESWLKKMHELTTEKVLEKENRGEYRENSVVIKNSFTGEVSFRPPMALEVRVQIEEFFSWINSDLGQDIHPILRAGITHYELVRIHPFVDGNGRVARAFALLVLYREGYDVKRFFSLEEYFDKNAEEYYVALQSVSRKNGDLTLWLEFFTKALAIELNKIKDRVRSLSIDFRWRDRLGRQIALSERQIKLIEYLTEKEQLIVKDGRAVLPNVSDDTILRDIKDLMAKGVVKKRGSTKNAYYVMKK
ncbi:MAG: Fic family protein [Candidatus Beckwithbacteria bacterium]|nr:Fic family protein [Candidatus Beckwithbacteria bacterium]